MVRLGKQLRVFPVRSVSNAFHSWSSVSNSHPCSNVVDVHTWWPSTTRIKQLHGARMVSMGWIRRYYPMKKSLSRPGGFFRRARFGNTNHFSVCLWGSRYKRITSSMTLIDMVIKQTKTKKYQDDGWTNAILSAHLVKSLYDAVGWTSLPVCRMHWTLCTKSDCSSHSYEMEKIKLISPPVGWPYAIMFVHSQSVSHTYMHTYRHTRRSIGGRNQ